MKKFISILLTVIMCISLFACTKTSTPEPKGDENITASETQKDEAVKEEKKDTASDTKADEKETAEPAIQPAAIQKTLNIEADVKNGYTFDNGIYTFTKGGIYKIFGDFEEGQLYVNAPDEEVELQLAGVSLTSKINSVIFIEKAEEVKIKALDGTVNYLYDLREKKVSEDDAAGSACIFSKDDLKIQGKGALYVEAHYNNGIHSKNDIKIKNLTLEVTAPNNAIKGNDSITIESGTINITSTEGDGLKTKDTDISSKGKQRGIIDIQGGTVTITAASKCIKAAFDVQISEEAKVFTNK